MVVDEQVAQVDERTLAQVVEYHLGTAEWLPNGVDFCGQGSQRTVYVNYDAGVVYKVGDESANRREVRVLAELRAAGADYAPPASLRTVRVVDIDGEWTTISVVVMPYLPDDGSLTGPRPVLPGAGDFNINNTHGHGGRWWLIDAGGL